MLISYIIWTACSAVNNMTGSTAAGIVVIVCLFTFYFHYDICYTPLLMSYSTEILPFSIRYVRRHDFILVMLIFGQVEGFVVRAAINLWVLDHRCLCQSDRTRKYWMAILYRLYASPQSPPKDTWANKKSQSAVSWPCFSPPHGFSSQRREAILWKRSPKCSMGQTPFLTRRRARGS